MASYYIREDSPFYWVRFQKPDGTWGSKSSGIRRDGSGAVRKVKEHVADAPGVPVVRDGDTNAEH